MATYSCTLSKTYPALATYIRTSVSFSTTNGWDPTSITVPVWNNGRKVFTSYKTSDGNVIVTATGKVGNGYTISSSKSLTEVWAKSGNPNPGWFLAPAAICKSGTSDYPFEIVYDGGVWYRTWSPDGEKVSFDASHPVDIPTAEASRFVGCYSTNATTGTKYINADGTPTSAFLALAPTDDITIYAQFEVVSVKITINSSYGDYAFKTFYQSKTADASGKFGYYSESDCRESSRIYGIPRPTRELYSWGGLRSSSSSTSTLYANSDGTFTDAFLNRSSAATTVYGSFWTQVSYKVTVDARSGTAPVLAYYNSKTDGGIYADWLLETPELQSLPIPYRAAYRFTGYKSSTTSGTLYVDENGVIQSALKTRKATTTIYAQWAAATATVTLDARGGTGGKVIYYDSAASAFFDETSAKITSVPVPEYAGNTFTGYFDSQTGGTQKISASGAILSSFSPTDDTTLYAQWTIGKVTVEVDAGGGEGGTARFFHNIALHKFYADEDMTVEITSVELPSLRLFSCNGLFTDPTDGTSVVSSSGAISSSFRPTDEFVTIYAQFSRRCYEVVVDASGGDVPTGAIYHAPSSGGSWYSDDALTTPVSNVGTAMRTGYNLGGFYYGDTQVIGANGAILSAAYQGSDYVASARWTAKTYTLRFDAGQGTASFTSKTVTFNAAIGALPTATLQGRVFDGWFVNGQRIEQTDVWTTDSGATAVVKWVTSFGNVEDFFSLGDANLVPIHSESGDNRERICVSHTGPWEANVDAVSGVWRNPTVTYMVVGQKTLAVTLGKAFRGTTNVSGFMITSVKVDTKLTDVPTVVVSAVANEGADAINKFNLSVAVSPRHRPQNLMSAISGGGELQSCTLVASCDPVVIAEPKAGASSPVGPMPCASDVVHGKITVTATTGAYDGDAAPTAGSGFVSRGEPVSLDHVGYKTYGITVEKAMVKA